MEFKTREQLKAAMSEYIEYYNNERINTKRKGLSPLAYRQQSFQDLALI
ncbi:IS3 family transposase [Thomasclavelia ramosa]